MGENERFKRSAIALQKFNVSRRRLIEGSLVGLIQLTDLAQWEAAIDGATFLGAASQDGDHEADVIGLDQQIVAGKVDEQRGSDISNELSRVASRSTQAQVRLFKRRSQGQPERRCL